LARYLARLANEKGYTPRDSRRLARQIRELLQDKDAIGNLRISTRAIEFDLFASNPSQLETRRILLESKVAKTLTLKLLDQLPPPRSKLDALHEGIGLFNEERYWECHEVLEQIWHPAKGTERDIIQGLILTAAALVHAQKEENDVCFSMLRRAKTKLDSLERYEGISLDHVRTSIETILESRNPAPFKVGP
jgi:hypothetical protein